jgi:hypothetical protein
MRKWKREGGKGRRMKEEVEERRWKRKANDRKVEERRWKRKANERGSGREKVEEEGE